MASPFRLFRKYQTTLLVIAGVVLMFVFVVGDPLMSYMRSIGESGGGGAGGISPRDVAVRWDGGKLSNAELSQLVYQRRIVNEFVREVEYFGRRSAIEAGREPGPLRVDLLVLPERPDQAVEQDVVRMLLFAEAARQAGMQVDDEQVIRYLHQLGRGYVTADHMRSLIARLQVGGRGASIAYVMDALREEMLARNYLASYMFALDTVLPEQRWQDWLRVNDRVVVEVAATSVGSFLVDVPEPSESELTAFFEEFGSREPMPQVEGGIEMPSPNPAFAVPRKIELQYVRADYDQLLKQASAEITDEEIKKFYEDNKDPYFIRAETELLEDADGDEADDAPGEQEKIDPAEPAAAGDEPTAPADDQSSIEPTRQSPFRLAAFADDAADAESAAAEVNTSEGGSGDVGGSATSADPAAESGEPAEKPVEFQPLEEVRDEIRQEIAQLKVSEQLETTFGAMESELKHVHATYLGALLDALEAGQPAPPLPPELADLTGLAKKHGFAYERVGPVSALELRDLALGTSRKPSEEFLPFFAIAFRQDLELYEPVVTRDSSANRYLVMKTSDTPGRLPELAAIRDEVVAAWKRQRAADLALKHAQEEAKKARQAESLEEHFAGHQAVTVTKTDPFSWLTTGTVSDQTGELQSFRYSKPEGIQHADTNVMQTIFDLEEGEVGAVLNHDHSIAYLLRLVEHELTLSELRQAYLAEADRWNGLRVMNSTRSRMATRAVLEDMLLARGVHWERDPDVPLREAE